MYFVADAPSFTDNLTAWATLGLFLATALTLVAVSTIAVQGTRRDERNRAADKKEADDRFEKERVDAAQRLNEQRELDAAQRTQDREEADRRLLEEREAADKRLLKEREIGERRVIEERAFATAERLHERQAERAAVLLGYVALFRSRLILIEANDAFVPGRPAWTKLAEVTEALVSGAHVDAPLLGDAEVEKRYRTLVHLFLSVRANGSVVTPGKTVGDLRNYAKFVKLSLIALVNGAELPQNDGQECPILKRIPGDGALWNPTHITQARLDEDTLDPLDPQFRPLP